MAVRLLFPSAPSSGQIFTATNAVEYIWSDNRWDVIPYTDRSGIGDNIPKAVQFIVPGAFSWTVPDGLTSVWITMTGGGGGGGNSYNSTVAGSAGGAAEFCEQFPIKVISGGQITGIVGAAGLGGAKILSPIAGGNGEDTSVISNDLIFYTRGGFGGGSTGGSPGRGGGVKGAISIGSISTPGLGLQESNCWFGGAVGGGAGQYGGGSASNFNGAAPGANIGGNGGGGGGAASPWGVGGKGGNGGQDGTSADISAFGAGGGGAGGAGAANVTAGGDGGGGYVLIEYIG